MSVCIVTDSACDVPEDYIKKLGIRVIAAYINFGLESIPDDGVAITREDFYNRLAIADPPPTTSAQAPGESEKVLREVLQEADHVVAVHISSKLSGILGSTNVAAQTIGGDRISIFDTGTVSMGAGWQVIAAAEAAANGADVQSILQTLESMRARACLWAAPITLDYMRRSGRVNALIAGLGDILQIKPIIEVKDGEILRTDRVRTFKKVLTKLPELARSVAPLERLAVLHLQNHEGAAALLDALQDIAPPDQTITVWASSAVGANFGPGGVGLALVRREA